MQFFKSLFDDDPEPPVWQLRDIKFDIDTTFQFLPYERILHSIVNIQDEKGNPRQPGAFIVSNLRLIWYLIGSKQVNLSIGHDTVSKIDKKVTFFSNVQAKYILMFKASKGSSKYEFHFSSMNQNIHKLAALLISYQEKMGQTLDFRKLIVKPSFLKDGRVDFLPNQTHVSNYNVKYMYNEATGVEGTLYVSNIRVVFQTNVKNSQSFSLPWVCILQVRLNDEDVIPVVILKVKYNQGFHMKAKQAEKIFTQLTRLCYTYNQRPILGIEEAESIFKYEDNGKKKQFNEDIEIVETGVNILKVNRNKNYEVGLKGVGELERIGFSEELGLAIQEIPEGKTIQDLWRILK